MPSAPSPPDRPSYPRPLSAPHLDFSSASSGDFVTHIPPYQPVASSSTLHDDLLQLNSANYRFDEISMDTKGKTKASVAQEPETPPNEKGGKSRPTVRYVDNLGPSGATGHPHDRADNIDMMSSRASSIAADDEDSDDYDWSGEEDLVDEEARFEERMGVSKPQLKGWGLKRVITTLFSTIIGSTFLAGLLVVPGVLVQKYWYEPDPTEHRRYVKDNVQAWLFWAAANLVVSWYLAMIVDVIPVLVQFFISASWGHVSEYVKTRIEMYDSLHNNIKPLLYAASGWASWIIIFGNIYGLYDTADSSRSRAGYTERLEQVVEFFFFFSLVICIKQMLSHTIAFFFHRTAYRDRIQSVQEALSVIETLRQYRSKKKSTGTRTPPFSFYNPALSDRDLFLSVSGLRTPTPPTTPPTRQSKLKNSHYEGESDADHEDPDRTLVASGKKWKRKDKSHLPWNHGGSGGDSDPSHAHEEEYEMEGILSPRSGSPTKSHHFDNSSAHRYPPMSPVNNNESRAMATLVHATKVLKNAVLHDARNLRGKNIGEGSMAWNVSSTQEAKRLARSIYQRFKDRGRTYLIPADFIPAFVDEASAHAAFRVFDKDGNGDISRAEIKTRLVKVYKERRLLSRSMRDVGTALKTLDQILLLFAMIILFFIGLSVFGVEVGDSLTSVYSIGIAASFIFKNSASSAFDSIMFLFVTHPYDTGDRCFIDQENLVVKKVGLFATVFARSDGTETYYFNSQLFTKFITNVRRSGKMFENLTMQVAWRTPLEKLDLLEKLLNEWLSTEENRWYDPPTSLAIQHIEFQRYLTVTIGIGHNACELADWDLRNKRKTAFHAAVQYYCHQLDITFHESQIPVVYVDPETGVYVPPSPPPLSNPAVVHEPASPLNVGEDPNAYVMKPNLGFLPPPSTRGVHLSRTRKSKSKKASMRGLGAD